MNTDAFKTAYNESRNGANYFVRHPMARRFHFSDGVKQCADAGCHWLLDIAATELPQAMHSAGEQHGILEVKVADGKALMKLTVDDDRPPIWSRTIDHTDMPEGKWTFELCDEDERIAMILLTEH